MKGGTVCGSYCGNRRRGVGGERGKNLSEERGGGKGKRMGRERETGVGYGSGERQEEKGRRQVTSAEGL